MGQDTSGAPINPDPAGINPGMMSMQPPGMTGPALPDNLANVPRNNAQMNAPMIPGGNGAMPIGGNAQATMQKPGKPGGQTPQNPTGPAQNPQKMAMIQALMQKMRGQPQTVR